MPDKIKTVRDLMRFYLRQEGLNQADLAPIFDMQPSTVKRLFWDTKRPLAPQYIDKFIAHLKLDEFDAVELRWYGALEAGWQLKKDLIDTIKYRLY